LRRCHGGYAEERRNAKNHSYAFFHVPLPFRVSVAKQIKIVTFGNNIFQLSATDLSNHLSCQHLTELNRKVALGELKRPHWTDPQLEILIERGQQHEKDYVNFLRLKGHTVVDVRNGGVSTLEAMTQGADVIVQAPFELNEWTGIADILIKVPTKSKLGDWSYEVQDTKLAQNTKAGTILQLCLYSDLLAALQGVEPEKFHVIKPVGNFEPESYRFNDFKAYYHVTKKNFEHTMSAPAATTYPEPAEHCGICRWWKVCDTRRHDDDYISLVAGIRSAQIEELKTQGVRRLEDFAKLENIAEPKRGNIDTYIRRQSQAKIQLEGRIRKGLIYEDLEATKGRGLNRLPEPSRGDIYFDIEGDEYYPDGGLEYILGYCYYDDGNLVYKNRWCTNRLEEKDAFKNFMQFVTERWKRFPNMYIYHFAPYEPTAIKRLARVHASYEKDVDDLLRAERFIDLHAVFKEALLASVESYSLKSLELFTKYTRKVELTDANRARKKVEVALELNDPSLLAKEIVKTTEDYNEDDCRATHALHEWLEEVRTELTKKGKSFERPESKTGEASEEVQQQDTWSAAVFSSLIANVPGDRSTWTEEDKVRWLLAHQIDYFRREDKSAWWEFFRVHELEPDDLLGERKALTGLKYVGEVPKTGRERNVTHRYTFPPQEHNIDEGDELWEVKGEKIGSVKAISIEGHTIDIKKTAVSASNHPTSVHMSDRINPGQLATSLTKFAEHVDSSGLAHRESFKAAKDLLMKRGPVLRNETSLTSDEDIVALAIRVATNLDNSYLAIQGPPGSGKTYTGARMIIDLVKKGKRIGITAISHKVIRNLIDKTIELSREENIRIGFIHKVKEKSETVADEITETDDSKKVLEGLDQGKVAGGTAWLWGENNSVEKLDYLFIDEAGQMSLSHALAASRAAYNLVLLGDPQQLEQPQKGAHPEGSDVAALAYLLDGHATIAEGKGLFLEVTRRLHPNVCRFTSELFYESKLRSLPGLENQVISGTGKFDGAGLFYVPVEHRGNSNKSDEETDMIANIVSVLMNGSWTDARNNTRTLLKDDILIVAPYNAQVSALIDKLPGYRIGTVDKFQGQEAPVVIYSMTSSSHEDAPRGMSFLFSPNRLNVATSRAKSVSILVASPRLLEPDCKTIDQMRWANGLCRYVEMVR
jgi:predicted RecB family nuclease